MGAVVAGCRHLRHGRQEARVPRLGPRCPRQTTRLQPPAQGFDALPGEIEHPLVRASARLDEALQVIVDAGDRIGQPVQRLPIRHHPAAEQLFFHVAPALVDEHRGAGQVDHVEAPAHRAQQGRHRIDQAVIPLRADKIDDRLFYLLQTNARFAHDRAPCFGGVTQVAVAAGQQAQLFLDLHECFGHRHQLVVADAALRRGQFDPAVLFRDHRFQGALAGHRQDRGRAPQGFAQCIEVFDVAQLGADIEIQPVLDRREFFQEHPRYRADGLPPDPGDAIVVVAQTECVQRFFDALAAHAVVDDVFEQECGQIQRDRPAQGVGARNCQAAQDTIDTPQDRYAASLQRAGHMVRGLEVGAEQPPQPLMGRAATDALQRPDDLQQPDGGARRLIAAQDADQALLISGAHPPRHRLAIVVDEAFDSIKLRCRQQNREIRFPGDRRGTQAAGLPEHRREGARATGRFAPGQRPKQGRHLQHRAHQRIDRVILGVGICAQRPALQRESELLHLIGQFDGGAQLQNLQRAVHVVQLADADVQRAAVGARRRIGLQRVAGIPQQTLKVAPHPVQTAAINHLGHLSFLPLASSRCRRTVVCLRSAGA